MIDMTLEYLTRMAEQLSPEDQLSLIKRLTERIGETRGAAPPSPGEAPRTPLDLYGIWRNHFPEDPDIETVLYEIRHEWEEEWPEVFKR